MTLRLTDEEVAMLRRQAEREHRSMHEVARLAILERAARAERAAEITRIAREGAEYHRELLDRLRDA